MKQDEFNAFCASLPHTLYVCQWGGADVWKVGTADKNKLFVVGGWNKDSTEHKRGKAEQPSALMRRANTNASRAGVEQSETAVSEIKHYAASFKCGEIAFEFLRDTPGCRPAPYLASRGMKWIQCFKSGGLTDEGVTDADLKDYLRESHRLASLNLTKKLQKQLGLNQGDAG